VDELLKNKLDLQVLTDTGWSTFNGLLCRGNKQTVLLTTQTRHIICTLDHKFFTPKFNMKSAQSLLPGDNVLTDRSIETIVSIKLANIEPVYDLLEVEKNHRFYANGILVKNCEFLIYDETLINSIVLSELEGRDPIERQGQVRWFQKPQRSRTYVIGLDPSLGTGGDPAAIQIFELPTMIQIGEWQHNKTPIQRQIAILKEICEYIYDSIGTQNDIYYSVENNTLGEAALVVIAEIGEENIRGTFLSQPHRVGQARGYRKGFTTTNKSKITVCAKMKNLVENRKMTICSKNLISELKTFVASGAGFAAKIGETDDLVSSTLLVLRMIQALQSFDSDLDEKLRDSADDYIAPMPFIMI
jgi:hypothetical protein